MVWKRIIILLICTTTTTTGGPPQKRRRKLPRQRTYRPGTHIDALHKRTRIQRRWKNTRKLKEECGFLHLSRYSTSSFISIFALGCNSLSCFVLWALPMLKEYSASSFEPQQCLLTLETKLIP